MTKFYSNELLDRKPLEEISIINNNRFSLLEKTSVKLVPILASLRSKMAIEGEAVMTSQNGISKKNS
jgi:hypothetical protein